MVDSIFLLGAQQKPIELKAQPYDSEDLLQRLLADYPHLIAGQQIDEAEPRRWLLITREMGVPGEEAGNGRWSLDHLFLDQDGVPTLVEVKRSTDSRIRREVVGQMLDYAANAVMFWPVEEIRARFMARYATEAEADEELSQFLAAENADPHAFWIRVKTNLQAGRIRMIFVADAIPTELKRVVEFLNEQMDPAEVLALELRQYVGENLKTLVPRVIGNTAGAVIKKGAGSPAKKQWDERSFFDSISAQEEPKVVGVVHALLDWAKRNCDTVSWGKGDKWVPWILRGQGDRCERCRRYSVLRVELREDDFLGTSAWVFHFGLQAFRTRCAAGISQTSQRDSLASICRRNRSINGGAFPSRSSRKVQR